VLFSYLVLFLDLVWMYFLNMLNQLLWLLLICMGCFWF